MVNNIILCFYIVLLIFMLSILFYIPKNPFLKPRGIRCNSDGGTTFNENIYYRIEKNKFLIPRLFNGKLYWRNECTVFYKCQFQNFSTESVGEVREVKRIAYIKKYEDTDSFCKLYEESFKIKYKEIFEDIDKRFPLN